MKKSIVIFLAILAFSCGNKKERRSEALEQKDLITEDDCIFDQSTQTDEFLKDIQALKSYVWDYESRTATILLENHDTLLISRGGCYDFGVSAEFRIRNDTMNYKNWNMVFEKVLWIAKILESEFDYTRIKENIESNEIVIENYDGYDAVSFSDEYL